MPLGTFVGEKDAHATGEHYPKADGNQLYKMTLEFEKKPGREITPGMNIDVELRLRHRTSSQAYTLPLHCIFSHEGQNCVWVINNDSTVSRHVVSLDGTDEEGRAIVVDGLSGDEQIVNAVSMPCETMRRCASSNPYRQPM